MYHCFDCMSNVACRMALQELAQMSDWRQQLESELHDINLRETAHIRRNFAHMKRHHALSKELATENQQHGDTKQQLSAAKQDNLQLADELKVGLLVLPVLCCDCFRAKVRGGGGSVGVTAQYVTALHDCCLRMHVGSATQCQPNLAVQRVQGPPCAQVSDQSSF